MINYGLIEEFIIRPIKLIRKNPMQIVAPLLLKYQIFRKYQQKGDTTSFAFSNMAPEASRLSHDFWCLDAINDLFPLLDTNLYSCIFSKTLHCVLSKWILNEKKNLSKLTSEQVFWWAFFNLTFRTIKNKKIYVVTWIMESQNLRNANMKRYCNP